MMLQALMAIAFYINEKNVKSLFFLLMKTYVPPYTLFITEILENFDQRTVYIILFLKISIAA